MIGVIPTAQPQAATDAALVAASREGDRSAFGEIVRRYQGMVSGLIYAACGDLHRSEDLAQETFLSAWKSLSGLRDPDKLPAWLCQIARHRAQDQQRKNRTENEKIGVGGFWARRNETATSSPSPDEELLRKEEEAVLWHALAQIPQPYRETLVLYYRQGQSTEEVSAATETSEASVRQRLARGRQMLREQVSEMLERNLSRSAPTADFTSAVVAALPAILPAGKVVGASTAAKGSLAAANSGWLAALTPWLGLAGGLASGVGGSVGALNDDRTPVERRLTIRFLARIWAAVAVLMIGCVTLIHLHIRRNWSDEFYVPMLAGWFALYWMIMSALVARYQARSLAVRGDRPPPNLANGGLAIFSGLSIAVGTAIGALAWMIHLARLAGDDLGVGFVVLLIAIVSVFNLLALSREPRLMIPVASVGIFGAIVLMLNWRLDAWIAAQRGTDPLQTHVPLWSVNLFAAAVAVWVLAMAALNRRRGNK